MAFYTSKIDDQGNEIERRQSARSLGTPLNSTTVRMNLSTRSCKPRESVRFINPAAFIEKVNYPDQSDASSQSDDNSRSLNETTETESQLDIVPPLDFESEENYPTTRRDYTFSYRKHCEAAKIVLKPDAAYETWLSAKRKLISDEAARRKRAEEQKLKELEERKRLSQEKLQKWLDSKSKIRLASEKSPPKTIDAEMPQIKDEHAAHARRANWERTKKLEEERRRMLKQQEEHRRLEMEEQRRQMAADAWEKWLADAAKKPKPVPLNRGIFTLRGTISEIFVNPNEWQHTETIKNDD